MTIPFVDLKIQYEQLKEEINSRIQTVLNHGQFILGPEVQELEHELAEFVGCAEAITCSNGTIAITLALMGLGIEPEDEIITTAFSFIATAETIATLGAVPVFVDIDPKTYNLNPENILQAITPKTKAILPVSLYGQVGNMDAINEIAKTHGLFVIEDAAQSFGAVYKEKMSCNLTTVATTSFFPAKPLGGYGDGGAVFTNDLNLAKRIRSIKNHGQTERYYHPLLGVNGRLDTLQCAILLPKLRRYPEEIRLRNSVAQKYFDELKFLEDLNLLKLPHIEPHCRSVWAQYTIEVENREKVQSHLKDLGIPTAIHYPLTMPEQPAYRHFKQFDISISQKKTKSVLSLPLYADLPLEHQEKIIDSLVQVLKKI